MKLTTTPLLAIVTAAAALGMVTVGLQQAFASSEDARDLVVWRKTTHEFEKNMIMAMSEGNTDGEIEDLDKFALFMRSTFGPDPALDKLIANYEDGVRGILSTPPPDGDKRAQHDQIIEFRKLTNAFEQGSINQLTAASIPPN